MGNSSAKLEVELERKKYQVGDVVSGSLVLHAKKQVVCESLTLVIEGREDLSVNHSDGASCYKEVFHTAEILSESHQRVYDPGCHRFPFKYEVAEGLRGQFTRSGVVGNHGVDLRSGYILVARMKASRRFGSKINANKPVEVTKPRIELLPNSVRESVSTDVYARHQKAELGVCHVTAMMDRDVQVQGQSVHVQWTVKNETSRQISKVYLGLRATYSSRSRLGGGQKTVLKHSLDAVRAGESKDFEVELVLGRAKRRLSGSPMLITTQSSLLTVEFHVVIKCYYKRGTSVELVMPLRILPAPE